MTRQPPLFTYGQILLDGRHLGKQPSRWKNTLYTWSLKCSHGVNHDYQVLCTKKISAIRDWNWLLPFTYWQILLNAGHHDDVIKWKYFPRYWPFMWGIYRSPVNSPHKGQWRGALMFSLIYVWIKCWENNREASDLRRYCAHYDVIVMILEYGHHGRKIHYATDHGKCSPWWLTWL